MQTERWIDKSFSLDLMIDIFALVTKLRSKSDWILVRFHEVHVIGIIFEVLQTFSVLILTIGALTDQVRMITKT